MPTKTPDDVPWDAAPLTGRSLTMREYLDAVLWWVDLHHREIEHPWRRPLGDDDARRENLREVIQRREERRMLERVATGESWSAIKASTRGGRLE